MPANTIDQLKSEIADTLLAKKFSDEYRDFVLKLITKQNDLDFLLDIEGSVNLAPEQSEKYDRTKLLLRALKGDIEYLKSLPTDLSEHEINFCDPIFFDNTPVIWAAANGHNHFVYHFIKKFGRTIDFKHVAGGNNLLSLLLTKGYINRTRDREVFDYENSGQYSALNILKLIKRTVGDDHFSFLINQNQLRNNTTLLHLAYIRRDVDTINFLIESQAQQGFRDKGGKLPRDYWDLGYQKACEKLRENTTAFLLDNDKYEQSDRSLIVGEKVYPARQTNILPPTSHLRSQFKPTPERPSRDIRFLQPSPSPLSFGLPQINHDLKFDKIIADSYQISVNEQAFITAYATPRPQEDSQKNLEELIKSLKIDKISNLEAKTRSLLAALGEFALKNMDKAGKSAGFSAWKNNQDFLDLLSQKLEDNGLEPQSTTLKEFAQISAQLQKNANDKFDTIEGRHYKSDNVGARSFRLGILYNQLSQNQHSHIK